MSVAKEQIRKIISVNNLNSVTDVEKSSPKSKKAGRDRSSNISA